MATPGHKFPLCDSPCILSDRYGVWHQFGVWHQSTSPHCVQPPCTLQTLQIGRDYDSPPLKPPPCIPPSLDRYGIWYAPHCDPWPGARVQQCVLQRLRLAPHAGPVPWVTIAVYKGHLQGGHAVHEGLVQLDSLRVLRRWEKKGGGGCH